MPRSHPPRTPRHEPPAQRRGLLGVLGAVGRLLFALDRPPRNLYERQYLRGRAAFYFLLGVAATLAVQAALDRLR